MVCPYAISPQISQTPSGRSSSASGPAPDPASHPGRKENPDQLPFHPLHRSDLRPGYPPKCPEPALYRGKSGDLRNHGVHRLPGFLRHCPGDRRLCDGGKPAEKAEILFLRRSLPQKPSGMRCDFPGSPDGSSALQQLSAGGNAESFAGDTGPASHPAGRIHLPAGAGCAGLSEAGVLCGRLFSGYPHL